MKTSKSTKSKSNGNSPNAAQSPDITFKASFEDLRRSDSRKKLRQHFTGAFPEVPKRQSRESLVTNDMGIKDRLSRSTSTLNVVAQNPTAGSSSSSVDKMDHKRLSVVREANGAIDIEQAINLLQELKKSASPAELVALHKALLPTRDSIISNVSPALPTHEEEDLDTAASYVRHRLMLPPGVATRDGTSGDLLRTQEEAEASAKLKKSKSHTRLQSKSSIAALDLADDSVNPNNGRTLTPLDHDRTHMGAYRPGTLRITNGTASPEPGMSVHRLSLEAELGEQIILSDEYRTAPTTPEDSAREFSDAQLEPRARSTRNNAHYQPTTSPDYRESRSRDRSRPGANRRATAPSSSHIPAPRSRDPSQARKYKPPKSKEASQTREHAPEQPQIRSTEQDARLRSRARSSAEKALAKQQLNELSSKARLRHQMNGPAINNAQQDAAQRSEQPHPIINQSMNPYVATENAPRFAQRWSHRMSHISQEHAADPLLRSSAFGDNAALNDLARSLSVTPGGDNASGKVAAVETPEVALAKLTGSASATPGRSMESDRQLRPVQTQQVDSGYGSEVSYRNMQHKGSTESDENHQLHLNTGHVGGMVGTSNNRAVLDDDTKSLYTFDQILKSPSILSPLMTPSPPTSSNGRKHSSFLGLKKAKRSESLMSPSELTLMTETDQTITTELKASKSKKKLQKPMPESIRKEMRARAKSLKEGDDNSEPPQLPDLIPTVPDDLANTFRRRSTLEDTPSPATGAALSRPSADLQAGAPAEIQGEPVLTEAPSPSPAAPVSRTRSKSRNRDRARSSAEQETTKPDEPALRRSLSFGRKRSTKSKRRSGSLTPKQNDYEANPSSGVKASTEVNDINDFVPLFTDHASVARTLGSSPYDPSTNMFRRTVSVPGAVMHQLQSPSQISTNLSRSTTGGLRGMEAGTASELARMKSRDVAIQNNEEVFDRPRIATPKGSRSNTIGSQQSPSSRQERPPLQHTGSAPSALANEGKELANRPHSMYAESVNSIPPLPELPINLGTKIFRSDGFFAKRPKDNSNSAPITPVPNLGSAKLAETTGKPSLQGGQRPGDETLSIADAVKKAVDARRSQEPHAIQRTPSSENLRPDGPRKTKKSVRRKRSQEQVVTDSEGSNTPSPYFEQEQPQWEQQAKIWRRRRETIGETLKKKVSSEDDAAIRIDQTCKSPTIVVSRYTATFDKGRPVVTRPRTDSAELHAAAYQDLIGSDENVSDAEGPRAANLAGFTNTYQVGSNERQPRYAPRTDSAYSSRPYQLASSAIRERSPGGRVKTPAGNFHPYTPGDAQQAEQSRAESLATLVGATETKNNAALDVPRRSFHQQNDTLDSLIDRYGNRIQFWPEKNGRVGSPLGVQA